MPKECTDDVYYTRFSHENVPIKTQNLYKETLILNNKTSAPGFSLKFPIVH
jgi:hypothetical protein